MFRCTFGLLVVSFVLLGGCSRDEPADDTSPDAKTTANGSEKKNAKDESKQYDVRFFVSSRPGDVRIVDSVGTQTVRIVKREADRVVKEDLQVTKVILAGEIETLAVDGWGREMDMKITIDRFTAESDGRERSVLAKGTVIHAGRLIERPDGGDVSDEAIALLSTYLPLDTDKQSLHEWDIFTPKGPRKLGATWPAYAEGAVTAMRYLEPAVTAEMISGEGKLADVASEDGLDYLQLTTSLSVKLPTPARGPEDTTGQSASLEFSSELRFPATYFTGYISRTVTTKKEGTFQGNKGTPNQGYTFEYSSVDTAQEKVKYLGR